MFTLKKLCQQKVLEFQQNALLRYIITTMTLSQTHSDMKVKSVMLKLENVWDLDSLYERKVSFSCMSFHMAQKCQLGK
jgi:hypothetical protein